MKKFSKESQFDYGLTERAAGKICALTASIQESGMGLGLVVANEPGYYPIPLFYCNGEEQSGYDVNEFADYIAKKIAASDAVEDK